MGPRREMGPPLLLLLRLLLLPLLVLTQPLQSDPLCNFSPEEVHHWLEHNANLAENPMVRIMLARHAHTLLSRDVGGEILCYAPPAVLASLLRVDTMSGPIGSGASVMEYGQERPSSLHPCSQGSLAMVQNATLLWFEQGQPAAAIDELRAAAASDPRCCAPFREFSRHFLGGNSPFLNLNVASQRAEARQRVLSEWESGRAFGNSGNEEVESWDRASVTERERREAYGNSGWRRIGTGGEQWRELMGYAAAHVLYYGDQHGGGEGGVTAKGGDGPAAQRIFDELMDRPGRPGNGRPGDGTAEDAADDLHAMRRRLLSRLSRQEKAEEQELGGGSDSLSHDDGYSSSSSLSSFSKRSPYAPPPVGEQRLVVATVASDEKPELAYLRDSARRAGVRLEVLGLGQTYEGHETKMRLYDEFLNEEAVDLMGVTKPKVGAWDVVVLVDAYDVLLSPSIKDIAVRFRRGFTHHAVDDEEEGEGEEEADDDDDLNDYDNYERGGGEREKRRKGEGKRLPSHAIVFAAERSLWPDGALVAAYPPRPPRIPGLDAAVWETAGSGTTAAANPTASSHSPPTRQEERFLNSGTVVGYAWALKYMLRRVRAYGAITLCGPDDQRGFHRFFLENPDLVSLDYNGALFQTLHFLATPFHMDATGQAIMGGVATTSNDDNDGDTGATSSSAHAMARWSRTPCAVHGNGGDGKPAYARMVMSWTKALRGAGLQQQGDHQQQGEQQQQYVEVTPPPFSTGITRYMAGDKEGAEAAFRLALREFDETTGGRPGDGGPGPGGGALGVLEIKQRVDSAYNLGVVLGELERHAEAADAYARTLELEPMHEAAMLNLAGIFAAAEQWSEAQALVQRAIALFPTSALTVTFVTQFRNLPGNPGLPKPTHAERGAMAAEEWWRWQKQNQ